MARTTRPREVEAEFELVFSVRMRVSPQTRETELQRFAEYIEREISRRSMKPLERFMLKEIRDGNT